jgi:hypothetical protein
VTEGAGGGVDVGGEWGGAVVVRQLTRGEEESGDRKEREGHWNRVWGGLEWGYLGGVG